MRVANWASGAAALLVTLGTGPAAAGTASPDALGCSFAVENPHWSSGAGSVIFKTRVTCNSAGTVTFNGTLKSGPSGGPSTVRATTSRSQPLSGPGSLTFYTPGYDETNVSCSITLYFWGYANAAGLPTKRTNVVKVVCP